MNKYVINPDKVTKPIQLLAAWFIALIAVNGSFLMAAQSLETPAWASGLLVISSVLNVPIFIGSLFVLQTKFRAQLQEDSYYSKYLDRQVEYTDVSVDVNKSTDTIDVKLELEKTAEKIISTINNSSKDYQQDRVVEVLKSSHVEELTAKYGGNRSLSELFQSKGTWLNLIRKWAGSEFFERDIDPLIENGLVSKEFKGYRSCKLTPLGKEVAELAKSKNKLWSQVHKDMWDKEREALAV